MSIDWDDFVLAPVMGIFGEGDELDPSLRPLYTPRGGTAFLLADAVFDESYADIVLDGEEADNSSRKPCLGVRLSRFTGAGAPEPAQNDKVFIPAAPGTFLVKDVREDGHGQARLILQGPIPV